MALFTPILKYVWKENAKLDAARIRLQTPTAGVDCVCNIPYINDKTAEHMLDVYFPENSNERLPVIIDIHGGGWMSGSKEINKNFCTNIAVKGFCVFSINYRLAGKHKFNEQIEDIFEAFDWIAQNAGAYPADLENAFLAGDSAGGHYACTAAAVSSSFILQKDFAMAKPKIKFKAVAAISPAIDLTAPNPALNINLPELLGRHFRQSPYYKYMNLRKVATNHMPPFYICTSTGDFLRLDSYKLKFTLDKLGIENELDDFKGKYVGRVLPHVFAVLDPTPSYSQKCINHMLDFFSAHAGIISDRA